MAYTHLDSLSTCQSCPQNQYNQILPGIAKEIQIEKVQGRMDVEHLKDAHANAKSFVTVSSVQSPNACFISKTSSPQWKFTLKNVWGQYKRVSTLRKCFRMRLT